MILFFKRIRSSGLYGGNNLFSDISFPKPSCLTTAKAEGGTGKIPTVSIFLTVILVKSNKNLLILGCSTQIYQFAVYIDYKSNKNEHTTYV